MNVQVMNDERGGCVEISWMRLGTENGWMGSSDWPIECLAEIGWKISPKPHTAAIGGHDDWWLLGN